MTKDRTFRKVSIFTGSPEKTFKLGQILGGILENGDNLALFGTLGSGKTLLTQGIARGLNVPENVYVTSPTFTLVNEYPGRVPVYHIDLYRISEEDELVELGLDELMGEHGIAIIEWAEKLPETYLRNCNIKIELIIHGAEKRKISIESTDKEIGSILSDFSDLSNVGPVKS